MKKISDFIIHEADAAADADMFSDNDNEEFIDNHESDNNFIDDKTEFLDQEPSNYRSANVEPIYVTLSHEEAMKIDISDYADSECSDPENVVHESTSIHKDVCEFQEWEERIQKFKDSLKQNCKNSEDSFYNAILWGTYFKLEGKIRFKK